MIVHSDSKDRYGRELGEIYIYNDNNSIYVNDLEYDVEEILFFPEKVTTICESGLILGKGNNKQEVVMIPKKKKTTGFFEKLFHFFK